MSAMKKTTGNMAGKAAGLARLAAGCALAMAAGVASAQIQSSNGLDFANDPANRDVICKNVRVVPRDAKTATIMVDLAWSPSWRNAENHDAAWIFFNLKKA